MKKVALAITLSFILHLLSFSLFAQADQGFIYGKITTFDDEVYEGQIRWGKEEAYWTDMFNASKIGNENIDFLSKDEIEDLERRKGYRKKGWGNWNKKNDHYHESEHEFIHQFSCQFGEIKKIDLTRYKRSVVIMKDDSKVRISGDGYNDVGTEIIVYDAERGKVELNWSELLTVEFKSTPSDFESSIGAPLYGTVQTNEGKFTGLIQWDKDERVASDVLDGRDKERKRKFEFGEIAEIEKFGKGCDVKLKNGRSVFLHSSNDVNHENRGIIVSNPEFGRVVIHWKDFEYVTFSDNPGMNIPRYADLNNAVPIEGIVKMHGGKSVEGKIIYDLDEAYAFELLNGDDGRIEYEIPFRNIHKIVPQRHNKSLVELKSNNKELILEDSQDISERNEGILVFNQGQKPVYVEWDDVEEIVFK